MRRAIHIFVLMAMSVSVLTCGGLGTRKDLFMTNVKDKSMKTAVMSSAGFHSKPGVLEVLVSAKGGFKLAMF